MDNLTVDNLAVGPTEAIIRTRFFQMWMQKKYFDSLFSINKDIQTSM